MGKNLIIKWVIELCLVAAKILQPPKKDSPYWL